MNRISRVARCRRVVTDVTVFKISGRVGEHNIAADGAGVILNNAAVEIEVRFVGEVHRSAASACLVHGVTRDPRTGEQAYGCSVRKNAAAVPRAARFVAPGVFLQVDGEKVDNGVRIGINAAAFVISAVAFDSTARNANRRTGARINSTAACRIVTCNSAAAVHEERTAVYVNAAAEIQSMTAVTRNIAARYGHRCICVNVNTRAVWSISCRVGYNTARHERIAFGGFTRISTRFGVAFAKLPKVDAGNDFRKIMRRSVTVAVFNR